MCVLSTDWLRQQETQGLDGDRPCLLLGVYVGCTNPRSTHWSWSCPWRGSWCWCWCCAGGQPGTRPACGPTFSLSRIQLCGEAPAHCASLGQPGPAGHPRMCFQHTLSRAPTWWRFKSKDRALCHIRAHSMPDASLVQGGTMNPGQVNRARPLLPRALGTGKAHSRRTGRREARVCPLRESRSVAPKSLCLFRLLSSLIGFRYQPSAFKTRQREGGRDRRGHPQPSSSPSHWSLTPLA